MSLPTPHPQNSSPASELPRAENKANMYKLDEGNIKRGIKLAASDDKIAPFSTDNYQKLLSKHPQPAKFAPPNPENLDS